MNLPAVPQPVLDPLSLLDQCMFFLHLPRSLVFTGCESKDLDANPAVSQPQPVDPHVTGIDPLATYLVATTPDVSANASD